MLLVDVRAMLTKGRSVRRCHGQQIELRVVNTSSEFVAK
jgi:hypothetical protein